MKQRYSLNETIKIESNYQLFAGKDNKTNQRVCIKICNKNSVSAIGVKEFERECLLAQKLMAIDCPNIVKIYHVDYNASYYAMEYIEGKNIYSYMKSGHKISKQLALNITIKIAKALSMMYNNFQILHRDIKPHNIILAPGLEPKLCDLGIIKAKSSTQLTMADQVKGSLLYIAPELILDDENSIQSDMYSLGLTFFYMLKGTTLFKEVKEIMTFVKDRTFDWQPLEDRNIDKVILRMIHRDKEKRFPNYETLIHSLQEVINKISEENKPAPKPEVMITKPGALKQLLEQNNQGIMILRKAITNIIQHLYSIEGQLKELEKNNAQLNNIIEQSLDE